MKRLAVLVATLCLASCTRKIEVHVEQSKGAIQFSFFRSVIFGLKEERATLRCVRALNVREKTSGRIVWAENLSYGEVCSNVSSLSYGERLRGYDYQLISKTLVQGREYLFGIDADNGTGEVEFVAIKQ
jgi:hypothetical protein